MRCVCAWVGGWFDRVCVWVGVLMGGLMGCVMLAGLMGCVLVGDLMRYVFEWACVWVK